MEKADLHAIDERSREIFKKIVESYLATGDPVGSRNLSRIIPMALSPASVRNVMSDLEAAGLLYSPHTSAGRLPTHQGLRFFVDALMEFGDITAEDRRGIEAQVKAAAAGRNFEDVLAEASNLLSGLSRGAAIVVASKTSKRLKHIEFVRLDSEQALVVLVGEDGSVENRLLPLPPGLPAGALTEATNFLSARIKGKTLADLRSDIETVHHSLQGELDQLTARLVEAGLAGWSGDEGQSQLIVRGQANLLSDVTAAEDIERIRLLFADLEEQKDMIDLLGRADNAEGVRIYIGAENQRFSLSGSSLITAPFHDSDKRIIGAVGVIGPTRLNYARIVPMVDFTAKVVSSLIEKR
jgi:heat-inducible transcriptional repressor